MIIESLIQDKSTLTIDCAKAKFIKGTVVEIRDEFYGTAEIQNAIKLGFIKLVGEPPAAAAAAASLAPTDKMYKFRNTYKTKLAFECVRGGVIPGGIIEIPASKVQSEEIRHAVGYGMLEDMDGVFCKPKPVAGPSVPLNLEELTAKDIVEKPQATKSERMQRKVAALKAKPISKAADEEEVEEDTSNSLLTESKVIDPSEIIAKKKAKAQPIVENVLAPKPMPKAKTPAQEEADRFSFLDIFAVKPAAEAETPSDEILPELEGPMSE